MTATPGDWIDWEAEFCRYMTSRYELAVELDLARYGDPSAKVPYDCEDWLDAQDARTAWRHFPTCAWWASPPRYLPNPP